MTTDEPYARPTPDEELPSTAFIGLVKVHDDRLIWPGEPPSPPDPFEALEQASIALEQAKSGWRLRILAGTHPFVIPVEVSYRPVAVRSIPGPARLSEFLRHLPEPVRLVADLMLVSTPGHKGHASALGSVAHRHHAFTRGDLDRVPVAVVMSRPPRRSRDELRGHRRPVVVLLDTKVDAHDWLGRPDPELGGDGFWVDAGSLKWDPGKRLATLPAVPERELGDGEGHGTFSAGLVRQVAPDVQVLAVHAMPDDGDVYGDHILNALAWLTCDDGPGLHPGDVVCLPACFRPQLPTDDTFREWLAEAIGLLGEGVTLVAAAGNDGSDEPVYPAAFAKDGPVGGVRTVSVGALNTDSTTLAYYSNYGDWVTEREVGTSLVSTFPRINGARAPELTAGGRRSTDPDDFTGGFARWSGTSFAAAVHAGKLAQRWLEDELGA